MLNKLSETIIQDLNEVLELNKSRPYRFRTRLERTLIRATKFANDNNRHDIEQVCNKLKEKLHYLSDHSNQTSDGTLSSYIYLENDINDLLNRMNN